MEAYRKETMHEYSVMRQLVSALLDELEEKGVNKAKEVRIEVGELSFLGNEQLKFAFRTLSKDTILEGAELKVINVESKVRCEECGYEGSVNYSDDPAFHYNVPVISCPECGSNPDIIKGKETKIVGVTAVEEDDET
ncbi:MAG: hydrogenase maturation nickel metallochaperone HypA [Candidatus Thermoplasmatota archaeon]|nr:hydrogenase maturation nickel metallochaperone HypA [Candidatus Thermoplasmatota archaeon]